MSFKKKKKKFTKDEVILLSSCSKAIKYEGPCTYWNSISAGLANDKTLKLNLTKKPVHHYHVEFSYEIKNLELELNGKNSTKKNWTTVKLINLQNLENLTLFGEYHE